MWKIGVVGLGPAGCFFLACLPSSYYERVIVFESGSIGGDLGRVWGNVVANLTKAELAKAFHAISKWSTTPLTVLDKYNPDTCPMLSDVALQIREFMKPILKEVTLHSQHVKSVHHEATGWRIETGLASFHVCKLIVCTGGEPRMLDYPRPSIPLEIALDQLLLARYVKPTDRVVVFGTSHSGTLIMRNLRNVGCQEIIGVHRGPIPFCWSRRHTPECPCILLGGTGCHDSEGVKQESAIVADALTRKEWPEVTLLRAESSKGSDIVRAVMTADYVVYATGFISRHPPFFGIKGDMLECRHNPKTATLAPGAWGFGLAYPALYEKPQGGQAPDIGLPGFVAHIHECLPAILENLSD